MTDDSRDDPIAKLTTPEGCEQFARNVEARSKPELALRARRRAVELRGLADGGDSDAAVAAYQAVRAYEAVNSAVKGKRVRATRTWQLIERVGIIQAVEQIVTKRAESQGYKALVGAGLADMAFEAVVLRFQEQFSDRAVAMSRERLDRWSQDPENGE